MIYADNAATASMSRTAKTVLNEMNDRFWGNPSSIHAFGCEAKEQLDLAAEKTAKCFNADKNGVIFTSGGTEANVQAIAVGASLCAETGRKHVITSLSEHLSVYNTVKDLMPKTEVTFLPSGPDGTVSPEALEKAIRPDTGFVSLMAVNNETGIIQPIEEYGRICRKNGILFHSDGVQAAGQIPIDLKAAGIGLFSISAHKFGGPKGIGALIADPSLPFRSVMKGGDQQNGRRAGTVPVPLIGSMTAALCEKTADIENRQGYVRELTQRLSKGILELNGVRQAGYEKLRAPGTVSFIFDNVPSGESLVILLSSVYGIMCSSGAACSSGSLKPSRVLLAMGYDNDSAAKSVRFSLNADNTPEETDFIVCAVRECLEKYK